ncbi:peptide chain release factor 3, partial [Escherichia coli]|nr:peptide chain release factor 3 [Escherichia coli]
LDNPEFDEKVGESLAASDREELELVMGACPEFDKELFLTGELTPVYFGTALGNFGVDHMLDGLTEWAPAPKTRQAVERDVEA